MNFTVVPTSELLEIENSLTEGWVVAESQAT